MVSEERLTKIKRVVSQRQRGLVVVLEDIHDPHNAEAIFRTCDALGVQNVYLIFDKQKPWNPRSIGKKSSSSAHKWLTFRIFRSTNECIDSLRKDDFFIVGTVLNNDAKLLNNVNFTEKKIALLVGNEHAGLSRIALDASNVNVMLPMRGMVESLNVSVATALFLYEIVRQRNKSGDDYLLTDGEKATLVDDFTTRSSKR